ncbi:MAG: sugar O-acetyltransferase [Eubacteriales bacterium]|jgi:maltose O-acetyltransferase
MTEAEKQACGQLYNPTAADICAMRERGTGLVRRFNSCEDAAERDEILRQLFADMGENVRVNSPFFIDFGCHTHIGRDSVINLNCTFLDAADIWIGERVLIGPDMKIYTTFHPSYASDRFAEAESGHYFLTQAEAVHIGSDTWIGGNATILPGVYIGENTVIGAGSVVTRDMPDHVIAAGNPCRVIRENRPA